MERRDVLNLSMESQPQNTEFRINPENFHPCIPLLAIFEGHPGNIPVKLFSILTIGFTCVLSLIYRHIMETGHAPLWPCFSTDQICFSYFCRRSSNNYFCKIILNSDKAFQWRRFVKVSKAAISHSPLVAMFFFTFYLCLLSY